MDSMDLSSEKSPYQVVARRYRPQEFDQLIGQESIAKALSNAIETGRVGHAYLFTGARGVGKTSSARIFAKALDCVHGPTSRPCNECEICKSIGTGDDVDVIEIDGASNRGIGEMLRICQNASIRPSRARFKIYIIDEVHMLTKEAFNALLKTLEEPPEHVKFIFCTTEPNQIPITILSRCQRFDFAGIDARSISKRLEQILEKEGAQFEKGVCEVLARRANGSMRDAQSLLEQLLALAPENVRLSDVHQMLGTVDEQKIFDILAAIDTNRPDQIFTITNQAADLGVDFAVLTEQIMGVFRDLMVVESGCDVDMLLYSPMARFEEMKKIAKTFGIQRILASLQILEQTIQRMRYSTQVRLLAELALIRLVHLDRLKDLDRWIQALRSGQELPASPARPAVSAAGASAIPAPQMRNDQEKQLSMSEALAASLRVSAEKKNDSSGKIGPDPVFTPPVQKEEKALSPTPIENPVADLPQENDNRLSLDELNNAQMKEIWMLVIQELGGMFKLNGSVCSEIEIKKPDQIHILFPQDCFMAKDFCEKNLHHLLSALSQKIGGSIHLELGLMKSEEKEENKAPVYRSKRELMREAFANPMVKNIADLFEAELYDVRENGR
ncbi:MAG: DNA polymerase III subunit gamma/tau [Planctomycetia bacterium]|nr:DNA polymerase III subunit gamma/tau [Planctomycetia bacterium]